MEEFWLTRDEDGILTLWSLKPKKDKKRGYWNNATDTYECIFNSNSFPEVQWSDNEPTKVKLIIEK